MKIFKLFISVFVRSRTAILVYLTHRMALPLLRLIRKPERFPYSMKELCGFSEGSLGYDLALFLTARSLSLLPHYARHDIKHILLEYDTNDEGEVCLQCFMLGNRHVSFPVIATVLYGFITMPEQWKKFTIAFRRGKACEAICDWPWFEILNEPTIRLRERANQKVKL